ncbi:response regulator [Cellulophaga baltica]|uniref:response regulator n=1 Tax=Cellulophaga TaxID=104264 RepID=UPI001C0653C0|nr:MULTISPECIES: response regulator [Cellulophaga]MBU2996577.1 response regulator [Cellulophaga baltica]MDO6767971.1 response regulator [Cellulophaga sp. 1_MG-2023]
MNSKKILCIVDDDDIYKYSVKRTLKNQELTRKIITFSNGEEAIEFMMDNLNKNENLPDVIFLDINMPIMDGFQFMEEYVKIKPTVGKEIVIYMVSSSIDSTDIKRAKSIREVSDYLIKPISPNELTDLLNNYEM